MKTFNSYYTNKKDLYNFVKNNNIKNNNSVLLQVFTGICDEKFINNLLYEIKEILPNINIIGTTTDGEIINDNINESSTVLSFSIFEKTKIEIYANKQEKSSFQTAKKLIQKITNLEKAKVAIIFTDGLNTNGEVFLKAFNKFASHITVAGGLAGDNATFTQTFIFTQNGINSYGAVSAILYNPDLIVNTTFSFGWEAIGKSFTITKAVENRVYSIDNQTPTQLYKKYLGSNIGDQLPATGIEFPLIINRDNKKIARAVVAKEDDGSLIFAGNIKTGDKAWLGYGNMENILGNTSTTFGNVVSNSVESIFIYSCMARKRLLGKDIKTEIIPLSQIAPTSGFFTYGEFFNCPKDQSCNNQLLNQTMTILALSEDKKQKLTTQNLQQPLLRRNTQTIEALSHLISQSTSELNELNEHLEQKVKEEVEKNIKKEKQLSEQAKMSSLGEMIGNIAHQWRQPLTVISALSTGAKLKKELGTLSDKEFIKKMNLINKNVQHLSKTIDTFRDFIKEKREIKEVVLQDRINNALGIIEASLKNSHIKLINKIDYSTPINIVMTVGELSQVLINILNNAKDVISHKNIEDKWIKIDLNIVSNKNDENSKVQTAIITIEDNGGGVPQEILSKIFNPYFTTKHQAQGTGLGLHMSREIVTKHLNGNIYAKNTRNGAKFYIELPLNQ